MPGNLDSYAVLRKRGGSSLSTDTNDASAYPTTPPASTYSHFQPIPKIGGSEGGFIGLVVGLGVVFIASCLGVFFLLRHRKHGGRTVRGKSGEVGVEASAVPGFPQRRGTLFGFRSQNPKNAGWMRAADEDDEWDANDNLHPGTGRNSMQLEQSSYKDSEHIGYGMAQRPQSPHQIRERPYVPIQGNVSSMSSINLVAPGESDPPNDHLFHDPFDPLVRTASPVQEPDELHSHYIQDKQSGPDHRKASADSGTTIATLPSGTKFKEEL